MLTTNIHCQFNSKLQMLQDHTSYFLDYQLDKISNHSRVPDPKEPEMTNLFSNILEYVPLNHI